MSITKKLIRAIASRKNGAADIKRWTINFASDRQHDVLTWARPILEEFALTRGEYNNEGIIIEPLPKVRFSLVMDPAQWCTGGMVTLTELHDQRRSEKVKTPENAVWVIKKWLWIDDKEGK